MLLVVGAGAGISVGGWGGVVVRLMSKEDGLNGNGFIIHKQ